MSSDEASKKPPAVTKSVSFIPMSPKSSNTMEMHRRQQEAALDSSHDYDSGSDQERRMTRPRRSSDSTHDRPRTRGHDSDSDEDVEDLPPRFNDHGQPLDRRSASHDRWTSRSGDFRRAPQRPGDWDVRGAWHVGGTDNEAVERLAHGVTNALDGRGSWMQVIGDVLGANANGEGQGRLEGDEEQDEERKRRRRRRRD